jgi:hypothetical protein
MDRAGASGQNDEFTGYQPGVEVELWLHPITRTLRKRRALLLARAC